MWENRYGVQPRTGAQIMEDAEGLTLRVDLQCGSSNRVAEIQANMKSSRSALPSSGRAQAHRTVILPGCGWHVNRRESRHRLIDEQHESMSVERVKHWR